MENLFKKIEESSMAKVFIIAFLILLFIIPNEMIKGLITERKNNEQKVIKEISSKWGTAQIIAAPYLTVPYIRKKTLTINGKEELRYFDDEIQILPKRLDITGKLVPVSRKTGIYKAILYDADLHFTGNFDFPDLKELEIDSSSIKWDKITFNVGISDMNGIKETIIVDFNGIDNVNLEPGLQGEIMNSGTSATIKVKPEDFQDNAAFDFDLKLRGSESISFIPLGKTTSVDISSTWDSPSFQGNFIPDKRDISQSGFAAKWNILDLNRNYPQYWIGDNYDVMKSKFGVQLIKTVSEYQKNMRTVKYSILIIVLVFFIYFFFEVLGKFKIHPIQYMFIGLALTLFFVLLLSLSEQIGFNYAYLVSAVATAIMILIYSSAFLKNKRQLVLLSALLVTIYGFIFVVLQMEDYALLVGSTGLFVALFATMYYSRKIDWYKVSLKT